MITLSCAIYCYPYHRIDYFHLLNPRLGAYDIDFVLPS